VSLAQGPRRRGRSLARTIGAPAALLLVLAVVWQIVATTVASILPPLQTVVVDIVSRPAFYLTNLGQTLGSALLGFVFGVVVALALSVLVVYQPVFRAAIVPVALLVNVTPIVAISPALIVAFGFTAVPHIIVAALSAFFPMLINAISGLNDIDPEALDVFTVLSASRWEIFTRLRVPSSLRYLFAGGRLAVTAAMVGAVVSEFTGTATGIGAIIAQAQVYNVLTQMWAAIFFAGISTIALLGLVGLAERLTLRW
jgi:NitT/TauT family transport system permease protein